jgi:hypothetical protein
MRIKKDMRARVSFSGVSRYMVYMSHAQSFFQGYIKPVRLTDSAARRSLRLKNLPSLSFARNPDWAIPTREECRALWDKYAMPDHIRAHSTVVAEFAACLARMLAERGADIHVPSVLASGLLHDLGKFHTIKHGGSHGQLGGAWVMNETRNPLIAQGVLHHVRWPWAIDETVEPWLLAYCIIYADKRVMHDMVVTPEERYEDLLMRYGATEDAKKRITSSHNQGLEIEAALSRRVKVNVNEYSFDSGRLVKRA